MNPNSGQLPLNAVETGQPTHVRWRILALLLAYSFMSWFNRVSITVAYNEQIKDQLGISPEAIGAVYSTLLFAYMIFMTPGGLFADRYGACLALVIMGFGSGLFVILTGLPGFLALSAAQTVFVFLVVRAAMGICTAPIYPASSRSIAHWLPFRQRALANGLVMGAALVGNASTFHGFGSLMDLFGWPVAFLITGTVTVSLAVLWTVFATDHPWQHRGVNEAEWLWIQQDRPDKLPLSSVEFSEKPLVEPSREDSSWWSLLRNRSLVFLTLSYAAVGYFEYLLYFWMHYYFDDVLHLGKERSRNYAMIANLSMAAGMGLGGWLSDYLQKHVGYRLGRALVAAGGMIGGAGFLTAGIFTDEPILIVTCFALAMASVGATEGPFWATALDLGGRRGGTSAGIFNTGGNAGGALAPIFTPLVGDYFGWNAGIGLGALVCLAGVAFWIWIDPAEGRYLKPAE